MILTLQFIQRRRIPWWGISVMLVLLIVAMTTAREWFHYASTVQADRLQLNQLEVKLKEKRRIRAQQQSTLTPQETQKIKEHAKIVSALNYPWNQVFGEIELTQEPGVAVLGFSHDQSSQVSQLTLEALDTPSIIRYAKQLNGEHSDGRWYIANYQVQAQNVPQTVKASLVSK